MDRRNVNLFGTTQLDCLIQLLEEELDTLQNKNQKNFRNQMKQIHKEQQQQEEVYSYIDDKHYKGYYASEESDLSSTLKFFRFITLSILTIFFIFGIIIIITDPSIVTTVTVFLILSVISFILGILHPVLVWGGKRRTRLKTAGFYGMSALIFFILLGVAPDNESHSQDAASQTTHSQELNLKTSNSKSTKAQPEQEIVVEESKDDYIASTKTIDYILLARNPEKYKDERVVYTGKVIQTIESGRKVSLRVNVTKGDYGIWKDTLFINYQRSEGEDRILEDDIITLWGTVKGLKKYTSVLGSEVTIPEVDAKYITIIAHDN